MPCGETQRMTFRSKLNVLRSVGRQSSFGETDFLIVGARHQHVHLLLDEVDGGRALRLRRTGRRRGNAIRRRNEVAGRIGDVLLTMRFRPGKLRSVKSKFTK